MQEQHLTAVEREELREVALGGPDTATRTRTVWQAGLVTLIGERPDLRATSPRPCRQDASARAAARAGGVPRP